MWKRVSLPSRIWYGNGLCPSRMILWVGPTTPEMAHSGRGGSNGDGQRSNAPSQRSTAPLPPIKFLVDITRHLGWKFNDYTVCWYYNKKLHLCIQYIWPKIFSSDQSPSEIPVPLWCPKVEVLEPPCIPAHFRSNIGFHVEGLNTYFNEVGGGGAKNQVTVLSSLAR